MQLKSIKRTTETELTLTWNDEHVSIFPLRYLREMCPCAGCKGETVLFQSYIPEKQPELPGHNELRGIEPVGNYAIKISWKDGHDTGLYSMEYLRRMCVCAECKK
ncbi:MAG: DUF971 domain-containing protein [Bacteroidota bacterium]